MVNVLDYGAVGDGKNLDSPFIQKAIDECHSSGGGRVYLPGGRTYKSGSIVLKSNVELYIETGAVIMGSDNISDYMSFGDITKRNDDGGVPSYINCEYNGKPANFFIYAEGGENIRICGGGTIDGNEEIYYGTVTQYHIEGAYYPRTPLFFIENIHHFTIQDVTLQRSAYWTLHMVGCRDVSVDGIRILNNMKMANCDGIDPDHCQNVRITNCHVESADDCIVFKTSEAYQHYGPLENVIVSNCTLKSTSAAIKFGSESESDFRNIIINNCIIYDSNRGISMQLRDKGNIENVQISNMSISTRAFADSYWGKGEPIYVTAIPRHDGLETGIISNVQFRNISCDSEIGMLVYGNEKKRIHDVSFENIGIRLSKKSKWEIKGFDLRPKDGAPTLESLVYGLYTEFADNITVDNLKVSVDASRVDAFGGTTHMI